MASRRHGEITEITMEYSAAYYKQMGKELDTASFGTDDDDPNTTESELFNSNDELPNSVITVVPDTYEDG